jgi:hypothetical protein
MTVDLNTRTWTSAAQLGEEASARIRLAQADHWLRTDHGIDALEKHLDCIDVAVVHGFRSTMLDANVPNEYIADIVSRQPNRLVGFAGIDPIAPGSLNEIHRILEMGLSGITMSPSMQGVHPTHSSAMRIYEVCEERGIPIMVSRPDIALPSSVLEFDRPGCWDEVARTFPALKLVIGNLGYPWIDETLALVQKHENLFTDLAVVATRPWLIRGALLSASALGVMDRILFASGWPANTPAQAIESLYSLNTFTQGSGQPSVPRSEIRTIIERDTLSALGIERSPAIGRSSTDRGNVNFHATQEENGSNLNPTSVD